MESIQFNVRGMSCQGCAGSVERRLRATPGVFTATVELAAGIANISYDETVTNADALAKVVASLGFDVVYGEGKYAR